MIIKVCGMREPENIRQVSALGIDWMGFIFYAGSPRAIGGKPETGSVFSEEEDRAQTIQGNLPVEKVGVFVNAEVEEILQTTEKFRLDSIQLHGKETPATCRFLRKTGYKVIKAFQISSEESLKEIEPYTDCTDYFLFDTSCKNYGGSGLRFDWSVLESYRGKTPFLLSGGIGPEQVGEVRKFHHPCLAGIDLNSKFEIYPGKKEINKLAAFIRKIRE